MASTENTYTGNGSTTQYDIDFPYLRETDVKVTLDEVLQTSGYSHDLSTDRIIFTTAPDLNVAIRIFRDTDVDTLAATFFSGSSFRAKDLNDNFKQHNFRAQEIDNNTWDKSSGTVHSTEPWQSNDNQIATTAAMDARFQDELSETITSSEVWPDNDDTIATTAAIDNRIDTAITNDIAGSDGVSITDDGDGTITVGLSQGSVDLDRIKPGDIITEPEQNLGPTVNDSSLFTSGAASKRFDTLVQTATPTATDYAVGKTWLQNDDDLTLSVWNGSNWVGIASGGTFINQPKVVYVDAAAGDDGNDGHRISRPKKTIRAAIAQINADNTFGDGSIVSVAPGIYAETLPIDIQKNDVGIIGQSLRTCIVHPAIPAADQGSYDVDTPHAQELTSMFRVNSGSYFQNLTLTGMKASGSRGASGSLYEDSTYGLPPNQGWNFSFYPGAVIKKSPYIQNCTNFSDSQINNVTFTPHVPNEGAAGDLDSAPTGGGILVDGSVPSTSSPLRSIVCDSYTHTALDGPGIFVTNNGYMQATSSYAFFNHAHITCINGGQANLAASTTDFGRYALLVNGKSTSAIFTSNVDGAASDGAVSFNINQCTAGTGWFGDAQRPATNMVVEVNSVVYPILSATPRTDSEGNTGFTVTISRPDPNNRSTNLGLNGALTDNASVSFFLRSMIASSGHTMEYVGSGTNYNALPENGGVPNESRQKTELNGGKIWTATTDHNGKFTIGGNQSDVPIFEVNQETGFVTIPTGSISFELASDATPQLGAALDAQSNKITSLGTPTESADAATKGYVDDNFVADAGGTMSGNLAMDSNNITGVADPSNAQDAATKNYVDTTTTANPLYVAVSGDAMTGDLAMGGNKITGLGAPTADTDASTKKYVDDEVAALVDSSPETLNTLNELAAAINDDDEFFYDRN